MALQNRFATAFVRLCLTATLVASLVGCGGSRDSLTNPIPTRASVQGSWVGTYQNTDGSPITIHLQLLNDEKGLIGGAGDLTVTTTVGTTRYSSTVPLSVSGTFAPPSLNVTIKAPDVPDPAFYTANVTGTQMTGTLNGAGIDHQIVVMNRTGP